VEAFGPFELGKKQFDGFAREEPFRLHAAG
jgi:hypothetical protein